MQSVFYIGDEGRVADELLCGNASHVAHQKLLADEGIRGADHVIKLRIEDSGGDLHIDEGCVIHQNEAGSLTYQLLVGDGVRKLEMNFLPDVYITCEQFGGRRFNKETLEVRYAGKNIAEVLDMTVAEAYEFFGKVPRLANKLKTLVDVGLGYLGLGQPATTLSGGEAQRIKLATELSRRSTGKTLYLLDEPTTGLHFDDIAKLMTLLLRLRDAGNTVVVIEHNIDVMRCADWMIDLGPGGGDAGGTLVCEGPPDKVKSCSKSVTGRFL